MEPIKTHGAVCEAVDSTTAGAPPSPGVSANPQGDCEAVDRATASAPPSPGVFANLQGDCEAVNCAIARAPPFQGVSDVLADCKSVDRAIVSASHSSSPGAPANVQREYKEVMSSSTTLPRLSPVNLPTKKVTRLDVYNALVEKSKCLINNKFGRPKDLSIDDRINVLSFLLYDELNDEYRSAFEKNKAIIIRILSTFICKCDIKYKSCNRHKQLFVKKHGHWLNKPFINDIKTVVSNLNRHPYFSLSERQRFQHKKRLQKSFVEETQSDLIKTVSETIAMQNAGPSIAAVYSLSSSCAENPAKAIELSKRISNLPPSDHRPFSAEEALEFMIASDMSVKT